MKILKLTDKQSALLERTLFGLLNGLERDRPHDPVHLGDTDGLPTTSKEREMLSRIWFQNAKLEGAV